MAEPQFLKRAPLREAVIDIRFGEPAPLDVVMRHADEVARSSQFERVRDLRRAWVGLQVTESEAKTSGDSEVLGKRLDSTSPPHVVQYRTNGFTFSRLYPYESWASLRDCALPLWNAFAGALGVSKVTRIALRYINELKLPLPVLDFADYLRIPPRSPKACRKSSRTFCNGLSSLTSPQAQSP